ncbi:MAG: hypothetical protein VX938_03465, partial [Myxococcota bacterium]|nr:hypothetical protein [Myxococcota bacterium]MEE2779600.1 hypothetical protein [Myxococcota bacterium]
GDIPELVDTAKDTTEPEETSTPEDVSAPEVTEDTGPAPADTDATPIPDTEPAPGDIQQPTDAVESPVDVSQDIGPPFDGGCTPGEPCDLDKPPTCYEGICNPVGHCVASKIPDCCLADADCSSLPLNTACGVYKCVLTYCVVELTPGCCDTDINCNDGVFCTVDTCESPGSMCTHCPNDCACPSTTPAYLKSFASLDTTLEEQGLLVQDAKAKDKVTWRTTDRRWVSPPTSLWLGDENCPTYYNGPLTEDCQPAPGGDSKPVDVDVITSNFNLGDSPGGYVALMWTWSQVEGWKTGGDNEPDVLEIAFQAGEGGVVWPITSTQSVGKNTYGEWRLLAADLSPWSGNTGRLHLHFRSIDDQNNHHEGVYVDDIQVVPRCAGGCCDTDADCGDLEVENGCEEARCVPLDKGAGNVCAVLPRTPGEECTPCGLDATCADDNPCTEDVCTAEGICSNEIFCCFESLVLEQGFESGLVGWYLIDYQLFDDVFFHPTLTDTVEGTHAATIWPGSEPTYDTGAAVDVGLLTSTLTLPESTDLGSTLGVSFWLKLSTEWDGQIYDNPAGIDRLNLEVMATSGTTEIWSSDEVEGSTDGLWVPVVASLDAWAGESVQLRFNFRTVDGEANDFAGPMIDAVEIGQICPTD